MSKEPHIGQNIRNIRILRGMKQTTFAQKLGIAQQNVSKMEKKQKLTDKEIANAAKILETTADVIKKFDEASVIQNNFLNEQAGYIVQKINPLEKIVELYDTIIRTKDAEIDQLKVEVEELKNRQKTSQLSNNPIRKAGEK